MSAAMYKAFAYCEGKWVPKDYQRSLYFNRAQDTVYIWYFDKCIMQKYITENDTCETVLDLSSPSSISPELPKPPALLKEVTESVVVLLVRTSDESNKNCVEIRITEKGGIVGSGVANLEGFDGLEQKHVEFRHHGGGFQVRKCLVGQVAFLEDRELDCEWFALQKVRGTLHLGKLVKCEFEVVLKTLFCVSGERGGNIAPESRQYLDRAEQMRARQGECGTSGIEKEPYASEEDDDMFSGLSITNSRAGIGHKQLNKSESIWEKTKNRYNSLNS